MKKILLTLFTLLTLPAVAQTPAAKKAASAVFSLNTFRADGTLLSTSHGVFTSADGYAVSQWKPFAGAAKAVVIDASGKKYDVDGLVSANDLYDVCRFHVRGTTPSAKPATAVAAEKSQLWLAAYSAKAPRLLHATVRSTETFSQPTGAGGAKKDYPFYIVEIQAPDDVAFCPFVNAAGEVVALLQTANGDGTATAVAALFPADMTLQTIGAGAMTLTQSDIPALLPSDFKEAQLALVLAAQQRKAPVYRRVVDQFIAAFPNKSDGYEARARQLTIDKDFAAAARDMEKAIAVADNKAEAHHAYSTLILEKETYMSDTPYDGWSLDKALSEARAAYSAENIAAYKEQEARVLFAKKQYAEAENIYLALQETSLRGPETMLAATQCRQAAGETLDRVMELMDSTIASCPHPLTYQSAPYVLRRGAIYQAESQYRKAIADFNLYEKLMVGNRIGPEFYYNRFVCEREARIYQQALDDIAKASELAPRAAIFLCEQGALQLRLKMLDEAIASANKALIIDMQNADAYAVLGSAQCAKGQTHEGLLNLDQAKSLGYENADALIKKYKK